MGDAAAKKMGEEARRDLAGVVGQDYKTISVAGVVLRALVEASALGALGLTFFT